MKAVTYIQFFSCIIYREIQLDKWKIQEYTRIIKVDQDI